MKTKEKVRQLLDEGITDHREIARRLGIHPESARRLIRDPEGIAVRASHRRRSPPSPQAIPCRVCGELFDTLGSHLRVHNLTRGEYLTRFPGAPLASRAMHQSGRDVYADRVGRAPDEATWWTQERIIHAIRAWEKRTGRPPTAKAWLKRVSHSMPTADGMPAPGYRPSGARVIQVFGSWSAAIQAAGFSPRPSGYQPGGKYRKRKRPSHCKRGHPLRGKNLYVTPRGHYQCRTCHRDAMRERYRAKRDA